MPDLVTINGDYNYGALARTGIFADFSATGLLDGVNPTVGGILNTLGTGAEGETNGVAFADNGSGIIYKLYIYYKNKAILFLIKLGFILYYIDFFIKLWYIPIIK